MDAKGKQPSTWNDYERGGRSDSFSSTGSRVHWDNLERHPSDEGSPRAHQDHNLRRRRSSIGQTIQHIGDAGGVNSFNNFARSWQRAAGFFEVTPTRPSFRITDAEEGDEESPAWDADPAGQLQHHRSLLRAALEHEGRRISEPVFDEDNGQPTETQSLLGPGRRASRGESIFAIEPSLASPFGGSYGTSYGSLAARITEPSMRHAGRLFTEQQLKGIAQPEGERDALLVKQIEEDGQIINVVVGQSTLPQTVFNSVNVLIGVGILSLPLALKYSGWVVGVAFFTFSAIVTSYTAKILAKCLDVDNSLVTFADLAYVCFGQPARVWTSILFSLELFGACVALVVLFADSLDALFPGWESWSWKIVCGIILVPLAYMPLRLLSFTSVLGIMSCFGIVVCVWIDGLIKPEQPGSLRDPVTQYLFPVSWKTIPLSFGLLMSPWGGHSVFPNIYRDMRHPYKYRKGVNITYIFTFLIDMAMAVAGILMFGDGVKEEITNNIFVTGGYPKALSVFIVICIAIIPITKVPLNARPIISTVEILLGLDARVMSDSPSMNGMSGLARGFAKVGVRSIIIISFVVAAIIFPSFDRIMTLLGAVACFGICIILPLAFHIKLFGDKIPRGEYLMNWIVMILSIVMAVMSTIAACLPKELLGA